MPTPKKHPTNAERQAAYRHRQKWITRDPAEIPLNPAPRWKKALKTLAKEMTDYYEARSENWQESEKGWELLAVVDALQDLHDNL